MILILCAKLAFDSGSIRSFRWRFPLLVKWSTLLRLFLSDNPIHLDNFVLHSFIPQSLENHVLYQGVMHTIAETTGYDH